MNLPPLAAGLLEKPDEYVGKVLLGRWIGFHMERKGVDLRNIPRPAAESLVALTQSLQTDSVSTMPLARALALAASGEFARAGALLREYIVAEGQQSVLQALARLGAKIRQQRRMFSKQGNITKKDAAEARQLKWRKVGKPLRDHNPTKSDSWLAKQIAVKTGDKESTIRASVGHLGLSKKKNC